MKFISHQCGKNNMRLLASEFLLRKHFMRLLAAETYMVSKDDKIEIPKTLAPRGSLSCTNYYVSLRNWYENRPACKKDEDRVVSYVVVVVIDQNTSRIVNDFNLLRVVDLLVI